jgi:Rrf2 family protein
MFSKSAEYALRAVIYIAQHGTKEKKLSLDDVAKAIDSPASFTAKILQVLTKENTVVSSTRGPNGGFYMTAKAKKLPVKRILAAMEEDEVLEKCVLGLAECSELRPCPMHSEYKIIKLQLISLFSKKTIQMLAEEIGKGTKYINNSTLIKK